MTRIFFWQIPKWSMLLPNGDRAIFEGHKDFGSEVVLDKVTSHSKTQKLVRFAMLELDPTARRHIRLVTIAALLFAAPVALQCVSLAERDSLWPLCLLPLGLAWIASLVNLIDSTTFNPVKPRDRFRIRTLNGWLPPESFIWLADANKGRSALVELRAIPKMEDDDKTMDAQISLLRASIDAIGRQSTTQYWAKHDVPELADTLPPPSDDTDRLQELQNQYNLLCTKKQQHFHQRIKLFRTTQVCAVLMERLRVAGLGGSYMELPHEDPLPFMERFIVDGKAKLKAKYELDAMDEPV